MLCFHEAHKIDAQWRGHDWRSIRQFLLSPKQITKLISMKFGIMCLHQNLLEDIILVFISSM
jgi:hypothetical protein